ncbi:MAG: hypothetical protein U0791_10285 [Gemmataceae bacterium]
MGQERTVQFSGSPPEWDAIRTKLTERGITATIRMIDGLPAFPDENPEAGWKELRVGFASGMVTLRRGPSQLTCVVWGNANAALLASWEALAEVCAAAGQTV